MRKRHPILYAILMPLVSLFLFLRFGYRCRKGPHFSGPTLVLSNHVTDFDPLFVGCGFPDHMYFVASEHIARWKNAFKFVDYVFAPIMRYKGSVAISTVREVLRRLKAGKSVCIFAEGGRCWDGVTAPILSSTGKLVKMGRCNLITYRLEGGYFVSPNWSEGSLRRGRITGAPVGVYSALELESMTADEINALIVRDLHEDAYARQKASPARYKGKRLAEKMENLLFLCPRCGGMDTFSSKDDQVFCTCGHQFRYTEYGMLEGTDFQTVQEIADWQKSQVERAAAENRTFSSPGASLCTVENHVETQLAEGLLTLSGEAFSCGNTSIPLSDISEMSMHGRHALVFSTPAGYYEVILKGANALKFLLLFQAYKGILHQLTERMK